MLKVGRRPKPDQGSDAPSERSALAEMATQPLRLSEDGRSLRGRSWRSGLKARPQPQVTGLRSLRTKFALGYILVALFAVAAITLAAVVTVVVNFNHFQHDQLSAQAGDLASQLGRSYSTSNDDLRQAAFAVLPSTRERPSSTLWLMDAQRQVILHPLPDPRDPGSQDSSLIQDALIQAQQGQEIQGAIPGQERMFLWFDLESRPFVALPIHAGGQASGQVVGSLALEVIRLNAGTPFFTDQVVQVLLLTVLGTAVIVALLGLLLARGVTRPLAQLTQAATRMADGKYRQRVPVRTKDEVGRLAEAFNEMAAALERDMGELRHQESLRRELAANVSHDLATPLTAIQGFTEALLDGVIQDERQREETLRVIGKEVVRLRRLVDDLSHLSRMESPRLMLDLAPLNLASLVDETLAVLQPEFEARGVSAHNLLDSRTPLVRADTDKLTQVLLNLLDNALRYTPSGGSISVSALAEAGKLRVLVRDTGTGIAPEHLQRIFDRFYRADVSRNMATGGSGLGLAIVKAIIEAHGGTVGVESITGKGTCVWFTLPRAK